MFKKISRYLDLKQVGFLEMIFALTPLLCGFHLGPLPLYLVTWVLIMLIILLQGKFHRFGTYKPLLLFIVYWLIHTFVIMVIDDVNTNGFIGQIIYFVAIFAIYPALDLKKLKGSLNWVAIISIAGLLYQWQDILRGGMVHPLEIPGLSMSESRLLSESLRPSSFFMEPAAYVSFMICPLFFALADKKYIWVVILILSMFLTTSTTGLILSFVILGVSALSERKVKIGAWIVTILIGGGLYIAVTNMSAFEAGIEKFENTDVTTNVRLSQGVYVVGTMNPSEYIFGVPYSTAYNYCKAGRAPNVVIYAESVYMSTFWELLLLFGIVGLVLYLNIYLQLLRLSRKTLTLVSALFVVLFSSSIGIGVTFVFTLIILLATVKEELILNTKKKSIW